MPNPKKLFRLWARRRVSAPRPPVDIPTAVPTTEVIFLIMRRMRAPLLFVIASFSFCTAGMMLMPGVDPYGNPYRLNIFDAFYQMTITLTTVGYTEAPHAFSYPQRMWLTMSIFLLVIGWAYAIAVFFALVQSPAFQTAVATRQFRRQVRRLVEPFVIIAGYGDAGRIVGAELDAHNRRFVVIDNREDRIESVAGQLAFDVPAVQADGGTPAVLGMAGLGHKRCEGVLALTNDDDANLSVVMTAALLRPDLPVLGNCSRQRTRLRMEHFAPGSAINADDRFGDYLALSIRKPITYQLLRWLMFNEQEHLQPARTDLAARRWVVCAQGEFSQAVVDDLTNSGITVELFDPGGSLPDVTGAVGFVAGSANDTANIAMAEHARHTNPDAYLVVRQRTNSRRALLEALRIESVYVATDLVGREVLARIITPVFWSFVEHAMTRGDDRWAAEVRDYLLARCGPKTPHRDVVTISTEQAPAVAAWLRRGNTLTLRDLMRQPNGRDAMLPLGALVLIRGGEPRFMPDEDTPLALDDQVLLVGRPRGLAEVREICDYPTTVEYLATGQEVPLTWVWGRLTARRRGQS